MDLSPSFLLRLTTLFAAGIAALFHGNGISIFGERIRYQADPQFGEAHYRLEVHMVEETRDVGRETADRTTLDAWLGCRARPLGRRAGHPVFQVEYGPVDLRGLKVEFDAAGDSVVRPLPVAEDSDFGYEVELERDGEILGVTRTGARTAFPNARLYEEAQNAFVNFLPFIFVGLPEGRMRPGSSWEDARIEVIPSPDSVTALLQTTAVFTLEDWEDGPSGPGTVARTRVAFRHAFAAANDAGESVGRLVASEGEGRFRFDLARGRPVDYVGRWSARMRIDAGGETIEAERRFSAHLRLEPDSTATARVPARRGEEAAPQARPPARTRSATGEKRIAQAAILGSLSGA